MNNTTPTTKYVECRSKKEALTVRNAARAAGKQATAHLYAGIYTEPGRGVKAFESYYVMVEA